MIRQQILRDGAVAYRSCAMSLSGAPNMGDSLYALKDLVFDKKKYTMDQVMDALDANWEGYESMYRDFCAEPKFGNDIPEVDFYVNDVWNIVQVKLLKYRDHLIQKSICCAER
ncbi:MAG: pyruvate formate lyase family protein [Eubacterium ramulus]